MLTLLRKADGKLLRTPGGKLTTDPDCCCDECPCCWQSSITLIRDDGEDTYEAAFVTPGSGFGCTFTDFGAPLIGYHCGDETFALEVDLTPDCTCQWKASSDLDNYDDRPCYQQFYLPVAEDDVCNYDPPGAGVGVELHKGTFAFRHVITVDMCYDPCGTMSITITHRVYCQFGVFVRDTPPPIAGSVTENWYEHRTVEVGYSEYHWTDVPTPSCDTEYDLGPATSETLADPWTESWGRAFTHCGGSSAFSITFPGGCASTGLMLSGTGEPCECP